MHRNSPEREEGIPFPCKCGGTRVGVSPLPGDAPELSGSNPVCSRTSQAEQRGPQVPPVVLPARPVLGFSLGCRGQQRLGQGGRCFGGASGWTPVPEPLNSVERRTPRAQDAWRYKAARAGAQLELWSWNSCHWQPIKMLGSACLSCNSWCKGFLRNKSVSSTCQVLLCGLYCR